MGCDASDEDSLISDVDGSDDYWTFMENPVYETLENLIENPIYDISSEGSVYSEICGSPIYDTSIEGSVDLETWESFGMEEEHSKFSFDYSELYYSEPHISINNEDFEKQYNEGSDGIQLTEDQSHPSSSLAEVLYDLEQPGAYKQRYQQISHLDGYDEVVDLPQNTYVYISPIQYRIEEVCRRTCQFGKQFDDVLHAYDIPSSPLILNIHAGLHFLIIVFLLSLVTVAAFHTPGGNVEEIFKPPGVSLGASLESRLSPCS